MKADKRTIARRDLLRALGAGAGAGLVAAPLATAARADGEKASDQRKARYKETEHVKTFYRVNRYPS
jgi:hypothetical protein